MTAPAWLDRELYPFESRTFEVASGRMHYVDEGRGPVVVLVHGTPTWSFLYRGLIRELSADYRVIAPDHLGFGLSDKPRDAPYRPEDHARNLAALIEHLELGDVTLVVHDFGGPIGLSYAVSRPENVRATVLFNTWMWSVRGTPAEKVSRVLGGGFGRVLYERFNFSPRVILRAAFADKTKLTPEIHRHYLAPFPTPAQRRAPWVLAGELVGSSEWYDGLWQRVDRIAAKPALLVWGMKDPAIRPDALARWKKALGGAQVVELAGAGHFVQEEAPEVASREVRGFLESLR